MFKAVCLLESGAINGTVYLSQETEAASVEVRVRGLSPGLHAISINECGDMTQGCASTGQHLNPEGKTHGLPSSSEQHAGDLGNLNANRDGTAFFNISSNAIALSGATSIIGPPIVIYADPDDLGYGGHELSKTTGNSGERLVGGVIGIAKR